MVSAKHILFVDDATDLRDAMTVLLTLKGYRVGWAANGPDALDYLRTTDLPGLILLDLVLTPAMDGFHFRQEQQRDPALTAIPVVLISAADNLAQAATALAVAGYLKKPVALDELVQAIERHH